jgi:hypothetical protein
VWRKWRPHQTSKKSPAITETKSPNPEIDVERTSIRLDATSNPPPEEATSTSRGKAPEARVVTEISVRVVLDGERAIS